MLISDKQHQANIRNAQQSTGPVTPEGKQAVRFNALKHGLRAGVTILNFEDAAQFNQLCENLESDWNPQDETERLQVEQMAIHQWLLRRLANYESGVFAQPMDAEKQMALLERFSLQRSRLENSFSKTIRDLMKLQKNRPARRAEKRAQSSPNHHYPAQPPTPQPDPGNAQAATTDTR